MSRRKLRWIKKIAVAVGAGTMLSTATCVRDFADTVGTGLSLTGATGVLGGNSQAASNAGAGLDLVADFIRFGSLVR